MKTPRIPDIISKLELVLENKEGWETTDYDILVFQGLTTVYGMDLLNSPTEYLHCEEDIRDWVKELQNIENSYHQKVRKNFN